MRVLWVLSVAFLSGCALSIPEVPKADLTISATTPAELSNVDDNSTLSVSYSWKIENYDAAKRYVMQVLLYDTNQGSPEWAVAFDLNPASGTKTDSYSGRNFYNCILGCVRKAALPFRVYYTIEKLDSGNSHFGTTLARSKEYTYN